jgi:hypothetical protein
MSVHEADRPVALKMSRAELDLLKVALRHLLASEDDPETIAELKALIARLAQAAERDQD